VVESADSGGDRLDQYVFVVRNKTGRFRISWVFLIADLAIDRFTQKTTSHVDIKSTWLRDILRDVCRDIRGVSLASSMPSVRAMSSSHIQILT
jgi:hypothetical protein